MGIRVVGGGGELLVYGGVRLGEGGSLCVSAAGEVIWEWLFFLSGASLEGDDGDVDAEFSGGIVASMKSVVLERKYIEYVAVEMVSGAEL